MTSSWYPYSSGLLHWHWHQRQWSNPEWYTNWLVPNHCSTQQCSKHVHIILQTYYQSINVAHDRHKSMHMSVQQIKVFNPISLLTEGRQIRLSISSLPSFLSDNCGFEISTFRLRSAYVWQNLNVPGHSDWPETKFIDRITCIAQKRPI